MSVNQAPLPLVALILLAMAGILGCSPAEEASSPPTPSPAQPADQPVSGLRFVAATAEGGEGVAARVGETVISISDVQREARARELVADETPLDPTSAQFRDVLEELVDQRLLALEAARRDLDADPEAQRRLAAAEERILGNILVETAVAETVTEEAIRRVYQEQSRLTPPTIEVRARHILLETREEADEAARLILEGANFAELATRISPDPATRLVGGDLGYFTRESIVPGFADVAFATAEGAVSAPFETEYGWHILLIVDRRAQPQPSLEAMRPNIVRFLTLQGIDAVLSDLRSSYPVVITVGAAPNDLRTPDVSEGEGEAPGEADVEPRDG